MITRFWKSLWKDACDVSGKGSLYWTVYVQCKVGSVSAELLRVNFRTDQPPTLNASEPSWHTAAQPVSGFRLVIIPQVSA